MCFPLFSSFGVFSSELLDVWVFFFNSLQESFDNFLPWSLIRSSGPAIRETEDFIMKVGWNHNTLAVKINRSIF